MYNYNFSQLQQEVGEWSRKNFPNNQAYHPLLGIIEELGELYIAEKDSQILQKIPLIIDEEKWVVIKGYEDYEISTLGRVKRITPFKFKSGKIKSGYLLKQFAQKDGYFRVGLHKNKKGKAFIVHQLMMKTFIGEKPSNNHVVNHKNRDRGDNRLINLEYVTYSGNMKHWQEDNKNKQERLDIILKAYEAGSRIAHHTLKLEQGIRGSKEEHESAAKDAVGDLIIFLTDYANRKNIDLQTTIEEVWGKVKQRDWTKNKKDGT